MEWGGEMGQFTCKRSYKQKRQNVVVWEEKSNTDFK